MLINRISLKQELKEFSSKRAMKNRTLATWVLRFR